jgi:LacI family transcriptional regulator
MPEATLRDVAKLAGVSLSTVSQALNNKPSVAPETRARVLEAATTLGYQQQIRITTPLVTQLSVVGMLTRVMDGMPASVNPFYSYVLAGVEQECRRQNLSLMYANIEVNEQTKKAISLPPMVLDKQTDGILIVGAFLPETIAEIAHYSNKPVVLVDAYAPGQSFDSIITDNFHGAYQAVSYLIGQGHTHIGLIGSQPYDYPSIAERRRGYIQALSEHQLSFYIEDSPLTFAGGVSAIKRLLQAEPRITAVFACNDTTALGVYEGVHELGLAIPQDISIVGFDDIDAAQQIRPGMTTVCVDKVLMGAIALRQLRSRSDDLHGTRLTTMINTHLMIRASVKERRG